LLRKFHPFAAGIAALAFAWSFAPAQQAAPAPVPDAAGNVIVVPARTVLQIRLRQTVSSFGSKADTPISAILIAPVEVDGKIVLPLDTELHGSLAEVRRVGLGFGSETAFLDLKFDTINIPGGQPAPLIAQVSELNNSRETVDLQGRIHGIRATATASKIISGFAISAASFDPMSQLFGASAAVSAFRIPESEIILPAGTELHLTLHGPLNLVESKSFPPPPPALPNEQAQTQLTEIVRPLPFRTTTVSPVLESDIVSILYVGQLDAIQRAFTAAGWSASDALNTESTFGVMRSVIEDQGYKEGPVSMLLLDGKQPVATYSKSLDTFFKRDHLRIYAQPGAFDNQALFASTATHDSGIGINKTTKRLIHLIDENIDEERGKVVNDLLLTGCVDGVSYIDRPWLPTDLQNATGDTLKTDRRIAVVRMNACDSPNRADQPAPAAPTVQAKAPFSERIGRDFILYMRDDFFRGNIGYQAYAGTKMLLSLRKKPEGDASSLKPKVLNIAGEEYEVVSRPGVGTGKGGLKDAGFAKPSYHLPGVARSYKTRLSFSVSGGYSRFGDSEFSTQNLLMNINEDPPFGGPFTWENINQLHTGWSITVNSTLDSWKYISNEFGYSYNDAPLSILGIFSGPGELFNGTTPPTYLYDDGQIRQFTYNVLFHARPNGKRFRPYVAIGPTFQLIRLTSSKPSKNQLLDLTVKDVGIIVDAYNFGSRPPLEGGGIFQFGLQYGAGFKYQITPRWFLRSDFRETLSPQPNWWKKSLPDLEGILGPGPIQYLGPGSYISAGPLRQQRFSAGFGVSF
jgi:opacity protein-like surface antigen